MLFFTIVKLNMEFFKKKYTHKKGTKELTEQPRRQTLSNIFNSCVTPTWSPI